MVLSVAGSLCSTGPGNCGVEPQEMGWGEAALLATGGPGSGCGVGSFREMVSTALRWVGVLANGDRRGLKPITELGWGAGGVVGGCVRDTLLGLGFELL